MQLHQVYLFASVLGIDVSELCPKHIGTSADPAHTITPQQKYLERAKLLVPSTKPRNPSSS